MANIKELEIKIKSASNAYYNGNSEISDEEYDALVYELSKLDPKNNILKTVGADPTSSEWTKEKHLIPLGSLNKLNLPEEMTEWIDKTLNGSSTIVCEKLDGLSIGLQYHNGKLDKACLRGTGYEGENILSNVLKMNGVILNVSDNFTGTIRGEILLTKTNHKEYFKNYSNPRNAASGLCRGLEGEGCEHLSIFCYQTIPLEDNFKTEEEQLSFLKKNNFITPNYKVCKSAKEVNEYWKLYQDGLRTSLDYEIDGLVVSANDMNFQLSLGETNLRPKGKIAFKFANQFIKTTVKSVEWTVGNTGRITPVCWFNQVELLGSKIEKASVYNIAYIDNLGLGINSDILVCKANEIIPRVEKVLSKGEQIEIPETCPSCGGEVDLIGENLVCISHDTCISQIEGRINVWLSNLNVLEWGDKLIHKLVESKKVSSIIDLYKLSIDDLAAIDRMGVKSATKCFNTLKAKNPISLDIFLGSLNIPMVAASSIRLLMESGYKTLDSILNISQVQLENVKGLGPVKSKSLFDGLKHNKQIIEELLNMGIKIKENAKGSLSGMKIAITGSTNLKRNDLKEIITFNGGEYANSVSKTCTHLIIADVNSTSVKAVSARESGIELISEEDIVARCE